MGRIKPQSAKAKGRKLQQLVRDSILAAFPDLHEDDVKSTSMGAGGEDVQLSPAARKYFPYSIECKSKAKIAVYSFYEQAKENSKGHEPLVVIKADRKKPLALIDLEEFMRLVKKL